MKIVVLDGYTENPGDLSWEGFEALGNFTVYDRTKTEEILERIGDAEIVITNKTPITNKTLAAKPQIKYIGVLATGYNIVDTAAAKSKGVIVTNIPTYGTNAVGQFAIALLLEICHHIGHHNEAVHNGRWTAQPDFSFWDYPLIELAGKTIGIIGFGRIGQATAKAAKGLGMRVIAYDTYQAETAKEFGEYVDLDTLYKEADVISLHAPLFADNTGMINKESIKKMKDGVIIINDSRGPLINEADLAQALNSGKVYAAGIDVVSTEPIKPDNVLLTAKNCIITPHIAWAPKESRKRLMDIAVHNLKSYLEGKPENVVS